MAGSPVDPDTAAGEGSPAAGGGPAGTLPAVGHTGHYLRGATVGNVSNAVTTTTAEQTAAFQPVTFQELVFFFWRLLGIKKKKGRTADTSKEKKQMCLKKVKGENSSDSREIRK